MKERILELSKHKENTRIKESSTIVNFSLEEIKHHFEENLQQIYTMANVITDTNKLQYQDLILRSQVVMLESAVQKMFEHV